MPTRIGVWWGIASLALVPALAPLLALAHPTDEQVLESLENRRACNPRHEGKSPDETEIDPIRLGMTETELRARVAGLRRDTGVGIAPGTDAVPETHPGLHSGMHSGMHPDAHADTDEPQRWSRDVERDDEGRGAGDDVVRIQYELWQGRVYRIRWRLAPAFERPIFDELAERGRFCLGTADLDQTFEAEPGSAEATLRRVVWTHEDRRIELRQLHPLGGGPVYLSATDLAALRAMGAAERAPFPDPSRSAPWWQRSLRPPKPADPEERAHLGRRFLALIGELSH